MISLAGKKYKISIGIEDPMTGKLAVRLSMKELITKGKIIFLANNIEE